MKTNAFSCLLLLAIIVAAGCKPSQPESTTPATASDKLAAAKQDAKSAAANLNDYAYAKKTEFVAAMREELAEANKEIDELGDKIAKGTAEAKAAAQPKLDALHAQAGKLKDQLDHAEDATEATWDKFKASTGKAYDDLKKSCNDARQWLSDKIAP